MKTKQLLAVCLGMIVTLGAGIAMAAGRAQNRRVSLEIKAQEIK